MNITNLIVLGLSAYLVWRGASRGFLRSILGPICLLIATVLSIAYYNQSKNIPVSLLIGLFGPMALHFFISNLLKIWHTMTAPEATPNPLSRLAGAFLTLLWGWTFILLTLVLVTIIPPFHPGIKQMGDDARASFAYNLIKPLIEFKTPAKKAAATGGDTEIATLANDPRFKTLLEDPQIQKAITENDMAKLLSNPKIMDLTQQLLQDPEMMKKLLNLHSQIQSQKK